MSQPPIPPVNLTGTNANYNSPKPSQDIDFIKMFST